LTVLYFAISTIKPILVVYSLIHIDYILVSYNMKENIEIRKNIINSLIPTIKWSNTSIEKRVRFLKRMTFFDILLTVVCAGTLVLSILSEIIGFKFIKWQSSGLLAILSLSFVQNLPNRLYELKLTKHLIILNLKSDCKRLSNLNEELKTIVEKLNDRLKNNWLTFLLALLILIMGIWQVGSENDNQFWNYMKLPILTFYGIILFKFLVTIKSLNKNIKAAETYCS